MTITRQRWIMRELSPGTFKRFTTVDKEITWMMFSHFCFHYLNGILGHFSLLFACFFLSLPEIDPYVAVNYVDFETKKTKDTQ